MNRARQNTDWWVSNIVFSPTTIRMPNLLDTHIFAERSGENFEQYLKQMYNFLKRNYEGFTLRNYQAR